MPKNEEIIELTEKDFIEVVWIGAEKEVQEAMHRLEYTATQIGLDTRKH